MSSSPHATATPGQLPASFTNRAQEQRIFRRLLDLPSGKPLPVLMFHGPAGIGKTWLVRKFRTDLPAGLPSATLDFEPTLGEVPYPADPARALAELRRQFRNIRCPRFDLAYSCLRFRQGERNEPLLQGHGLAAAATKAFVELATGPDNLLPRAEDVLERVKFHLGNAFQGSPFEGLIGTKLGLQDVTQLCRMAPEEIYPQLAPRLLDDLARELPERPNHACRGVIFLDSIEALQSSSYGAQLQGHWLMDLHRAASSLLLVLMGHHPLPEVSWRPEDRPLEMHDLGGLPQSEALALLTDAGCTNPVLRNKMLDVAAEAAISTEGTWSYHPLALGLCADALYQHAPLDPETFQVAPKDWTSLANVFFKSLPAGDEMWLRRLALTLRFDEEAAHAARNPVDAPSSFSWEQACSLSFMRPAQPGWWAVHQPVRPALANGLADRLGDHQFWLQYWRQRSKHETDEFAPLAWYHAYCISPEEAQKEWKRLAQQCRQQGRLADHYWLLHWWDSTGMSGSAARSLQAADALVELAVGYSDAALGMRSENLLRAIAGYEAALHWFTEKDQPQLWAEIQHDLGIAYEVLEVGNRAENLHKAIACHESALRVYTQSASPLVWATTQDILGAAYAELPTGDRQENLRRAIAYHQAALSYFTQAQHPDEWAGVMNNLGAAYADLNSGDKSENLRQAIACYESALQVHAQRGQLDQWAAIQNNLGVTYKKLPTGDREQNMRKAIASYEAALGVHTEADHPAHWASAQNNLGTAYAELLTGDRADNLRRAITCYAAALRVHTEAEHPAQWGVTQNNLGAAYAELAVLDDGKSLPRAIECYEAALRVRTETEYPAQWAATQNNLGAAYRDLQKGNRENNLQRAMECHEAALRIFTEQEHPTQWAAAHNFLASACAELESGNRQENLRRVIDSYESALKVFTRSSFLIDWSIIQSNLALALEELALMTRDMPLGRRAVECYDAAQEGYRQCGYEEEAVSLKGPADEARKRFMR